MNAKVKPYYDRALREVLDDMDKGIRSSDGKRSIRMAMSFTDLHDCVDANEYGGLTEDDCPLSFEESCEVQAAIDAYLKKSVWQREFDGEYRPPQAILDLLMLDYVDDESWHNDTCPRFTVRTGSHEVSIWFEHPDPEKRESVEEERYMVTVGEENPDEVIVMTDNAETAVAAFLREVA